MGLFDFFAGDTLFLRQTPRLVLASTSPRRKEILSRLQIPFQVISPSFKEISTDALSAQEEALSFAKGKARSVSVGLTESLVIGSDTLIECDGDKIGKPKNADEARKILHHLQGRSHWIWTGVFLIDTSDGVTHHSLEKVEITMSQMSGSEIDAYVATGEPLDKAGAYAVQGTGSQFVRSLKGDRNAAIGLPLRAIVDFLESRHFEIPSQKDLEIF